MQILVTYDISTSSVGGARRLRRAAKICLDYGQRVQNSVFECKVDYGQFVEMKSKILDIVDLETDSVRFYFLGKSWDEKVEHHGARASLNLDGALIV
jgi:CRISPR-associated protein Cas2